MKTHKRLHFQILLIFAFLSMASSFQLFMPVEQIGNQPCGPFKVCPNGTICMRLHNRIMPVSCFMPQFVDSSEFLPKPTPPPKVERNITLDRVKLIELPGCKCPRVDEASPCWTNDILSILFLLIVLALIVCVPIFMLALSYRRRYKY